MRFLRTGIRLVSAFLLPICATPASAQINYETIAHRGLYHDTDPYLSLAENSVEAVSRAYILGMKGVELDLRLDAEGNVLVTHDMVSNRTTCRDNADGALNPINVALNQQKRPGRILFNTLKKQQWQNVQLKTYQRNGRMMVKCNGGTATSAIQTLDGMLSIIKRTYPRIFTSDHFMIILDVRDHRILKLAAESVKRYGVANDVYLKFFASKALASGYTYAGFNTCYQYAKDNSLLGVNIIPQINDGELRTFENDDRGIWAFGRTLSIETYLSCWADAQKNYRDAPKMPIVSASVPADNPKATTGAFKAISWAQRAGRQTMTIVPNPDAGRKIGTTCRLFSFQSTDVGATSFDLEARQAKANFARNYAVRPTYIVYDVMGNRNASTWSTEFNYYVANLC